MWQPMDNEGASEKDEPLVQFRRIQRNLRQCIWMSAATIVLLFFLLARD